MAIYVELELLIKNDIKMKRYIIANLLISIMIMLTACDPPVYMDLYIKNTCNTAIIIDVKTGRFKAEESTIIDTIGSYSQRLIYRCETIIRIKKSNIPYFVQQLDITKENKKLLINPLDTNRWVFEEITPYKLFKSNYLSKATLTINPEDFEE
jgi:hypothetical protein